MRWPLRSRFVPIRLGHAGGARCPVRAEYGCMRRRESGQLADMIAMLVTDEQRIDIPHAEPVSGKSRGEAPKSYAAVDEQDRG